MRFDAAPRDASGPTDAAHDAFDAWVFGDRCARECGEAELCGDMAEGDGLDNDCNGSVDETCTCTYGSARSCFGGTPEQRGVGACADGMMHCGEFGRWSACTGGQVPVAEVCDGADNDCNGLMDDGLADCASSVSCPGAERARPLATYALEGSRIYAGAATSWRWTVTCPPAVATCPVPADPTARDTSIFFVASGEYRVRVEIVTDTGETLACEWVVNVQGVGLRVELVWDTQGIGHGDTDVDLHLHRRSVPRDVMTGETPMYTSDDCFFLNCKASTYDYDGAALRTRWGLPDTADLSACRDAPEGEGRLWEELRGACYNPRLDVDVITCDPAQTDPRAGDFCAPENINIDEPPIGDTYRVMVNYYSQHDYSGPTYPMVTIYCNGEIRGAFGSDPLVTLRNGGGGARMNDNWMVADIVFFEDVCGHVDCFVSPLGHIVNDGSFGPPWTL